MRHYDAFKQAILQHGVFANSPEADKLRRLAQDARYIEVGNVDNTRLFEYLGISQHDFFDAVRRFESSLPLDTLVCVEDEESAVFLDASSQRQLYAVDCKAQDGESLALISGRVNRLDEVGLGVLYDASNVQAAFVNREKTIWVPNAPAHDLVYSVMTAIEQMTYLSLKGQ